MQPSCSYSGQVSLSGLRHGEGRYDYGRGFKYEGAWRSGIKQGKGVFYVCDESNFEGSFVNGEISGDGRRTWANGSFYEGSFVLGEMSGRGKYVNATEGLSYEGEFLNNKFHGKGSLSCGEYDYEGDMEYHKPHGNGKAKWKNGDVYNGSWLHGKRHGYGMFKAVARDLMFEGRWTEDKTWAMPTVLQFYTVEADMAITLLESFPRQGEVQVHLGLYAKEPGDGAERLFSEESSRRVLVELVQGEGDESTPLNQASLRLYGGTVKIPSTFLAGLDKGTYSIVASTYDSDEATIPIKPATLSCGK